MEYIAVLVSAILIQNMVLSNFLGVYSIFGISVKMSSILRTSFAVSLVMMVSTLIIHPVQVWILKPFNLNYLQTIIYIIIIVSLFFIIGAIISKSKKPSLHEEWQSYAPFIITNSLILGTGLLNASSSTSLISSLMFSLGASVGYALILLTLTAIRYRLQTYKIPKAMTGIPIMLIIGGMMALALLGFAGII